MAEILKLADMRSFLSKSLSSVNKNKVRGVLAEIDLRRHLEMLGYGARVSAGGWIARSCARGNRRFADKTIVFFPETVRPDTSYGAEVQLPQPRIGLHTICSTFHQIGITSYYCAPQLKAGAAVGERLVWWGKQLGVPWEEDYAPFPSCVQGFSARGRKYGFLRYKAETSLIEDEFLAEEFTKEHIRIAFSTEWMSELADLDGLFWGNQHTYPLEIKEKTVAHSDAIGPYFGIDIGPFVKLAYYAAKRGNLHSMFVVREIDDEDTRDLVAWRFITFDEMAKYASWTFTAGGPNMRGGASATVRIPKAEFRELNAQTLSEL